MTTNCRRTRSARLVAWSLPRCRWRRACCMRGCSPLPTPRARCIAPLTYTTVVRTHLRVASSLHHRLWMNAVGCAPRVAAAVEAVTRTRRGPRCRTRLTFRYRVRGSPTHCWPRRGDDGDEKTATTAQGDGRVAAAAYLLYWREEMMMMLPGCNRGAPPTGAPCAKAMRYLRRGGTIVE